jgi:DNA-binding Lrp family transcriptional regulator
MKALKEAGYFVSFHTDLDLDRMVKHVLAYVEFTLENNSPKFRKAFESAIEKIPEFMDCLRVSGDMDYISFTCCSNVQTLNNIVDEISALEVLTEISEHSILSVLSLSPNVRSTFGAEMSIITHRLFWPLQS